MKSIKVLLFSIIVSYSNLVFSQHKNSLSDKNAYVRAMYLDDKKKLEDFIDKNIIPVAVEAISDDTTKLKKFKGIDYIKIYFVLNEFGEINRVENIEQSFVMSDDYKKRMSEKVIGMGRWKTKKKNLKRIYLWLIPMEWY